MAVVRLVKKSNQDTVEALQCLLALAKLGEVNDLDAKFIRSGEQSRVCTGCFRVRSSPKRRPSRNVEILTAR